MRKQQGMDIFQLGASKNGIYYNIKQIASLQSASIVSKLTEYWL